MTAAASLGDVGLTAERYRRRRVDQGFSGGEKARVAMATAIARNRPILLADEILAAVDPESTVALLGLFRRLAERGMAVALIVHQHDLLGYFDRVLEIGEKRSMVDRRNRQPLAPGPNHWPKVSDDAPETVRRWPKLLEVGLVLAILAGVIGVWWSRDSAAVLSPLTGIPAEAVQASVAGVNDDNTIRATIPGIPGTATIRLLGVAPALAPLSALDACYQQTTSNGWRAMFTPNRTIYLEQEGVDRDPGGTLPRDVWLVAGTNGQAGLADQQLVADGYAVAQAGQPTPKYAKWLNHAQSDAKRDHTGVMGACPTPVAAPQ